MKSVKIMIFSVLAVLMGTFPLNAGGIDSSVYPVAHAPEAVYNFEPVVEGTVIPHDFILENRGKAVLKISGTGADCGCTAVEFPKEIPPGGTGKISVRLDTKGLGGVRIKKSVTVMTDDQENRVIPLLLTGEVKVFAKILPKRIYLRGKSGKKIKSIVAIVPLKEFPFNVVDSRMESLEGKVAYTLVKESDRWILTVENLLKEPGVYFGKIYIKTDSSINPEISVPVSGRIS